MSTTTDRQADKLAKLDEAIAWTIHALERAGTAEEQFDLTRDLEHHNAEREALVAAISEAEEEADEPALPITLTADEKAVERARMAEAGRLAAIEGRVRLSPWSERNPHD